MDPPQPLPSSVTSPTASSAAAAAASNSPSGGAGTKLRLMCSYGGQIVPRPHDKTLCYAGGETRIVAVDRRTVAGSISALTAHLSRTLFGGRSFVLKYQLPNHDLDSLVSVATDEDLANMIDEYDRLALSPAPLRLRFFLFPTAKSDSGSGEFDARSEAWFIDSLRSARIAVVEKRSLDSSFGGEGQAESEGKCGAAVDPGPESLVLETNSSFGSTGSAASVSNLPAVKGGGGEEVGLVQVQDLKVNVPLVDSLGSDTSSMTGSNFQSPTQLVCLDSLIDSKDSRVSSNIIETETNSADVSPRTDLLKPVHVYGYALSQPMNQLQSAPLQPTTPAPKPQPQPTLQTYLQPQPQYIHAGSHYPTQYYSGAVQAAVYPTTYQPYLQQQQTTYTINKPFPFYVMPVGQAQPTDMSMQCSLANATATAIPSHPQLQPSPAMMVTSSVVYDALTPAQPTVELAAKTYRQGPVASPVTVPSDENKFVALAQMSLPSQTQPLPVSSVVESANYGVSAEYDDPLHAQIYKTQPPAPAMPSQFQNAATVLLSDNLSQMQLDNSR